MIDFLFLPVCHITHISFLLEIYVTNTEIFFMLIFYQYMFVFLFNTVIYVFLL